MRAALAGPTFRAGGEKKTELVVRFDYGSTVLWVTRIEDSTIEAIAGPERIVLRTSAELHGEDLKTLGEFAIDAGQSVPFVLSYGRSFESTPGPIDPVKALERTEAFWRKWSDRCPNGRRSGELGTFKRYKARTRQP
jgi:hypothetical protein